MVPNAWPPPVRAGWLPTTYRPPTYWLVRYKRNWMGVIYLGYRLGKKWKVILEGNTPILPLHSYDVPEGLKEIAPRRRRSLTSTALHEGLRIQL